MPTPEQMAALPKTPGSVVLASAAFSTRIRAWELGQDRSWRDVYGTRRSATQLRDVTVLHIAKPSEQEGAA